jgi:predicted aspartyl protease
MNQIIRRSLMFVVASGVCAASLMGQSSVHMAPMEITHGKPFVKVMINGQGPFRFVIDTGTGAEAFITPELADRLSLPVVGQTRLSDPSGQGKQRVPVVLLQSMELAGVEFSGVKAAKHLLSDDDGTCQGLLGFVLFKNYLLTLDYPRQRLTLASGTLSPDGERSVVGFRSPDGIPIVPLRVGKFQVEALIDSGGSGLSLPEALAAQLRFSSVPSLFENSHSLSTRFQVKAGMLASDVKLGAFKFSRPLVEINPAFPMTDFGSCPMQKLALTFDQISHLVRIEAGQTTLHLSATPAALRPDNSPPGKTSDPHLVPVG